MPSGGKKREKGRLLTFPTVPRATRQIFLVGKMPLFAENDHNPIQRGILQSALDQSQSIDS
ncbi:hypothetical protein SJDPG12_05920 [Porphyromonas gingivalis SJD12]|nr:hypothetical protein SJDPG12_05920 [Porphyromonas gingivalis SJD12]